MPATPLIAYDHVGKSFAGGSSVERVIAVDDVHLNGHLTLGENIGDCRCAPSV